MKKTIREQLLELERSKKNHLDGIKENKKILNNIWKAEQLDQKLPEQAKKSNSHLNDLKKEFSSYFDEDSGNSTTRESLDQLKDYLKEEINYLNLELDEVSRDIDNVVKDAKTSKRSLEDIDNQPDYKRPRNNNESSTGSGSLPPSLPSAPSSGSSPSSSSATSSKVLDNDGSVYKSSRQDYESNYYTMVILDFIISILNALGGDDGDKD